MVCIFFACYNLVGMCGEDVQLTASKARALIAINCVFGVEIALDRAKTT